MALRGDNATVAQAGPGLVYVAAPDGVHRISSEGHAAAQPLGGDEPLDPLFTGVPLAGTKILILSSAAEALAGSAAIGQVLEGAPDRALAGIFQRTREVPDMTAVLIADVADVQAEPAPVEIDLSPTAPPAPNLDDAVAQPPAPMVTSPHGAGRSGRRGRMPQLRRPRAAGAPRRSRRWLVAGLLLFAAVLAAAATYYVPSLFESDPAAEIEERLAAANGYIAAAATNDEIAWQRQQLQSALTNSSRRAPSGSRIPACRRCKPACSSSSTN